jgi:hypothetical protein
MAQSSKPDPNAIYAIHQRPLADLFPNQRAAFIAAGCALSSISPPGIISSCIQWTHLQLCQVPPLLGGVGADGCVGMPPDVVQLALDYHRASEWRHADQEAVLAWYHSPLAPSAVAAAVLDAPPSVRSHFESPSACSLARGSGPRGRLSPSPALVASGGLAPRRIDSALARASAVSFARGDPVLGPPAVPLEALPVPCHGHVSKFMPVKMKNKDTTWAPDFT